MDDPGEQQAGGGFPALPALLAIGGGLAWALCFQADPRSWLAWVALAPLVALVYRPRAAFWGFVYGLVYWLASLPWIATTVSTFGGLPTAVGVLALLLLAGWLSIETALLAALGRRWLLAGRGELHLLWLLPSAWVVLEAQRFFFLGGFPWNLAAHAWIDVPGALISTAWIGASGLSFLVVLANVGVALAVARGHRIAGLSAVLGVLLLLVLGGRFMAGDGPGRGSSIDTDRGNGGAPGMEVRLIQPNSPIAWDEATLQQNYRRLLELSHQACDPSVLLVWPESAAWPHSWESSPRLRADVATLARRGCGVLLGSPLRRSEDGGILNALFVVGAEGPGTPYAKRRLVPWGEYVPLKDVLPFLGKLARNVGDFEPGTDVALVEWDKERLGAAICYEVIFAAPVAEQVRAGASVLLTITNDAWYGDSSAPWQHLRAARFRAAETRRPLLRAALTGVSALVDERGRVVRQLGVGEEGVLAARVVGGRSLTPFVRWPWLAIALSALGIGFAIIRLRRSPAPGQDSSVDQSVDQSVDTVP